MRTSQRVSTCACVCVCVCACACMRACVRVHLFVRMHTCTAVLTARGARRKLRGSPRRQLHSQPFVARHARRWALRFSAAILVRLAWLTLLSLSPHCLSQ
jgi:hypothetical protein